MPENQVQWKRIEAGEYDSLDGRFNVCKTWDRLYGNHWCLTDHNIKDYYKARTACESLKHAKHVAEMRVQQEKGILQKSTFALTDDML